MKTSDRKKERKRRGRLLCGGVACLLASSLLLAPGAPAKKRPPASVYWGAQIGDQISGEAAPWDMAPVQRFQDLAGKGLSLIEFSSPFAECDAGGCTTTKFPSTPLENVRRYGAIPVFSWNSTSSPPSIDQPAFSLSKVIDGTYDSYIREFALKAKAWGHPFFLRFNWEMNGFWFPWSEGVNGNTPGQFVAAWRHVHDIFAAVGATNVTWTWCPFVDPSGSLQKLASLYPGDAYVDWTGLDGYNWGTNPASPRGWKSFDQLFSRSYGEIAEGIAPSKPMMLGEFGSTEQGGSKAEWIRDALGRIPSEYPQIRAALWFDKFDDGMDWPIETSSSATQAFAEGIQQPLYVGASYAGLTGGPIQPPS